jgi:chorismate mutase-like protein
MNLDELRSRIDAIDTEIVRLLNERASLAKQVAEVKGAAPKFAPAREEQVIANALKANTGPFKAESLKAIYTVA